MSFNELVLILIIILALVALIVGGLVGGLRELKSLSRILLTLLRAIAKH
jgi:hypothetical protein